MWLSLTVVMGFANNVADFGDIGSFVGKINSDSKLSKNLNLVSLYFQLKSVVKYTFTLIVHTIMNMEWDIKVLTI